MKEREQRATPHGTPEFLRWFGNAYIPPPRCEATHTHTMRLLKHTHTHTVKRPATHTHARVVGEHHAQQGHTNYALRREHLNTHTFLLRKIIRQHTLLCPKEMKLKLKEQRVDRDISPFRMALLLRQNCWLRFFLMKLITEEDVNLWPSSFWSVRESLWWLDLP